MSDEGKPEASELESRSQTGSSAENLVILQKLMDALPLSSEVPDSENPCDEKTQDERSSVEADKQQAVLDRLTAEVDSLKQDTKLRKDYAGRIF
jgi:hypothetical protein